MLRRTSRLLALVLLCGVGQAGLSLAADEPVKTGEKRDTLLYVRTDPPGAKVFLNGKEMGSSNGLFRVEPGTGTILIELEGRIPGERQVIIRADAVTRVELELKPETEAQGAHFIGRFPKGAVELVGVTNYPPTEQSQWWRPDGTAAGLGPFLTQSTMFSPSSDKGAFAFVFRLENIPGDICATDLGGQSRWEGTQVLDVRGEVVPHYGMFCAYKEGWGATASIRRGVDMGPWETVITWKADSPGASSFSRNGRQCTVTLQKPEAAGRIVDDSTRVRLTSDETYGQWKSRLIAVTKDGREHEAWLGFIGGKGEAHFDTVTLPSINEFKYQVRPYRWVEFQNISLQPGQKTAVKVTSPADLPARSSPPGSAKQEDEKAPQRKPSIAKKVKFVIGPSSFAKGDKIEIQEVRSELGTLANGDTMTVKGTYTLASHDAARLALYITQDASKATRGGSDPPGITRTVRAGTVPFEFQRPITCDGHLHLSFYDKQSGRSFGTVYFGTEPQMKEISHWNVGPK